jgi:serine protease Do
VVITDVDPASPAAAAGLKRGDVIQEVNRKPVTNTNELSSALRKSSGESLLLVNRGGNKSYVAL